VQLCSLFLKTKSAREWSEQETNPNRRNTIELFVKVLVRISLRTLVQAVARDSRSQILGFRVFQLQPFSGIKGGDGERFRSSS